VIAPRRRNRSAVALDHRSNVIKRDLDFDM
jgi:hypothetical protein